MSNPLVIGTVGGAFFGALGEYVKDKSPEINLLLKTFLALLSISTHLKYFNTAKLSGNQTSYKYIYGGLVLAVLLNGLRKK